MFERIFVGFDGSAHSHQAVLVATEVAARFHARLTVAVVRGGAGADAVLDRLVPLTSEGETLDAVVDKVRTKATGQGATGVESVVLRGDVVESILAWLAEHPQDLMVVGSRGLSRGRRLLLGSVSSALVDLAPCPVLVVRGDRAIVGTPEPKSTARANPSAYPDARV